MSLLCNRKTFTLSKFALRSDCQESSDTVLVGRAVWQSLALGTNSRTCLCLRPLLSASNHHNAYDHIVCWADLAEQLDIVAIPSSWPTTYKSFFGPDACLLQISLHNPVPLQEIILTALATDAYDPVIPSPTSLEAWFSSDQRILRCGTTYELSLHEQCGPEVMHYHLESSTPVLQGYVKVGFTNFVIMHGESNLGLSRHRDLSAESDGFEIDEEFLANSMQRLPRITNPSPHCFLPMVHYGDLDDDDKSLYVRTSDLIHLGVLDGDWLLATGTGGSKQKLVRVRANDRIVERTGMVAGSPILLGNICINRIDRDEDTHPSWILLQPSQIERADMHCLPLAQCITVACIISPLTTGRMFQQLLLLRLRDFFETRSRLVQQGDIISISLNTDEDHLARQIDDKIDDMVFHGFPSMKYRSNELAFFRVTRVVPGARSPGISDDLYTRYATGEFGCRVDATITRVIQEGVEHSHIPHLDQSIGEWDDSDDTLNYDDPTPLKVEDAHRKLTQVARVSLFESSVKYNLFFSILLEGPRGVGKYTAASGVARQLGMHLLEINCYKLVGRTEAKADALKIFEKASSSAPCVLILRRIEAFMNTVEDTSVESGWSTTLKECFEKIFRTWKAFGQPVLIVGTTSEPEKLPMSILSQFKHRVNYKVPTKGERQQLLNALLATATLSLDVSLDDLAKQTAALVPSDLVDLASHAKLSSLECCIIPPYKGAGNIKDITLAAGDFEKALEKARTVYSEIIGAPSIPQVSWDDVGGLVTVKSDILDTIQLPLEYPEMFTDGLKKRSGILLYGPPGTGKTLVAKAVATTFSLSFLSVKGPELLDMYIGESEANVRKIFQRARDTAPCVIFFDELDSIAPKRGNHGDSGGVMDRIVSQLLAELDGVATTDVSVFVIGATNRPDLLDSALLRPGRFDKILYLGFSDTREAQVQILRALTRKFRLDPNLDLFQVATKCSFAYSGADFYALCSDAMLAAISRKADEVERKINEFNQREGSMRHPNPVTPRFYLAEMAKQEDIEITVTENDFALALKNVIPSVSLVEMERYAEMRRNFSMTFI